jgi:hypothetical protein
VGKPAIYRWILWDFSAKHDAASKKEAKVYISGAMKG